MVKLTDTHIHLYAEEFEPDRDILIQQAIDGGVTRFFMPNIDEQSIAKMYALAAQYPRNCFPMIGLHPCSVKADYKEKLSFIESQLSKNKYYGIGETGIDLYWDTTFAREQEFVLRRQAEWAVDLNLPLVIHSRNSFKEVYNLLAAFKNSSHPHAVNLKGVFHCFTGTAEDAEKIRDLGFCLGIGGVVTFKNSGLDKTLQQLTPDCIILETDAPYLAPAPHRGKRNEPLYLKNIAQKVADIYNCSMEEITRITSRNADHLFNTVTL